MTAGAGCPGTGQAALEHGETLGYCPECGRLVVTDGDGTCWFHELDLLDLVALGRFGGGLLDDSHPASAPEAGVVSHDVGALR